MPLPAPPPRVSLILLSYQYERYIGETIRSVLAQTWADWELVVVDDGSTDRSVEVIRSFTDPRISLHVAAENRGAARNYNHGLELCRGELVGSVDADDLLEPRRLEEQVAFMDAHPEIGLTGTWITMIDAASDPLGGPREEWVNRPRDLTLLDGWMVANPLCHSSVLLRRADHLRVGGLDPALTLAVDFDLWARCLMAGLRVAVIPRQLTRYRVHGANASRTYDPSELFLELAFVFCKRLAPLAARCGRGDLLARGLRYFTTTSRGDFASRHRMHRLLAAFAAYPDDFVGFRRGLESAAGEDWSRLITAAREGWRSRATPTAEPAPVAPAAPVCRRAPRLGIVDDYFPNLLTSFRIHELNHHLRTLGAEVHSTNPSFAEAYEPYRRLYPQLADRVRRFDPARLAGSSLLYFVFLANAHRHLQWVEGLGLPFVFTLYPGAAFELHSSLSDHRLQEVCRSPLLERVIVTQKTTERYLLESGRCPPEKIQLIYGAPLPVAHYDRQTPPRRHYPADKTTFDVCFVAMKYMARGIDKGYPTFVAAAHELARHAPDVHFHVVGGMTREDLPVAELGERIHFHPPQPTSFFPAFYAGMDVILSPNVPFVLRAGAFDGFPTASCVEASLAGVAMFASDVLGENTLGRWYRPDEEIVVVEPRIDDIVPRLLTARSDPDTFYALAAAGQRRSRDLFADDRQLAPRSALLREILERYGTKAIRRSA